MVGATEREARAQEIYLAGPLAGKPAVMHLTRYRGGRISLAPAIGFTINDSYRRHVMVGARAEISLAEWLAIGAYGQFTLIPINASLADQLSRRAPLPTLNHPVADVDRQLGMIGWLAGLQAQLIPLRGKLSFFNLFVDIDLYLLAGVSLIGVTERADTADDPNTLCPPAATPTNHPGCEWWDQNGQQTSRLAGFGGLPFSPMFGAGMSIFISQFISLVFEWRGLWFTYNASGTDECCSGDRQFPDNRINEADRLPYFMQMVSVSVGFFLPPRAGASE